MPAHIEQVIFTDTGDGRGVRPVYRYAETSGGRRHDSFSHSRARPPPSAPPFPDMYPEYDYYPDNEEYSRGRRSEYDRPSRQGRPHPDDYVRRRHEATPPPPPSRKDTKNYERPEPRSKPWDPDIPSSKAHSSFFSESSRRGSGSHHSTTDGRRQHHPNNEGTANNDKSRRRTEDQDNGVILMPHLMFVRACLLLAKTSDIKKYFEPQVQRLESITTKIESIRPDDESFKDKLVSRELEFLEVYIGGLNFSKDMVSIDIDIKDPTKRTDLTTWITKRMAGAMEVRNNLLKGRLTFTVTDYDNYP
ncbi:hypothetical protein ACEPAI_8343 [Sanghuangporus weigelae]